MYSLIFATSNQAKVDQIKGALSPHGITVRGIDKASIIDIVEDGETAQENARKKAVAYASHLNTTVLSMDNALYFDQNIGIQPGIHVRRIPGLDGRPTDQQMIDYYSSILSQHGDSVLAHWDFALCIASPNGEYRETVIRSDRVFTCQITPYRIPGYPLESMQVDPETDMFIAAMSKTQKAEFWQRAIGQKLYEFVRSVDF